MEQCHSLPLERGLTLQSLDDKVELEGEVILADGVRLAGDRVAGPLDDGPVAHAVDLAKLGKHFLDLVEVFLSIGALEDMVHLLNDLVLAIRPSQQLVKHFLVALNARLEVLQTLLGSVENGLDKD